MGLAPAVTFGPGVTKIYRNTFSAVTSISVPAWQPGVYDRIEMRLYVATKSSTGNVLVAATGITAGYYSNNGVFAIGTANAPTDAGQSNQATFIFPSSIGPYELDLSWTIPTTTQKPFTGKAQLNQGNQILIGGLCIDATHAVSDLVVSSADTMTGWINVLGYS